jgi:protein-L-isoaspartate(D-aspartate) O-methyltransferase
MTVHMQHDGDMAEERQAMVEKLKLYGIGNRRVLDAFQTVRRHLFFTPGERGYAYEDCAFPIGNGQTISQPFTVAYMTTLLCERCPSGKVLEIGTGSGYQAAILHAMGYRVFTIERIAELHQRAGRVFAALGIPVVQRLGDGTLGWREEAPFDGMIVTAAAPREPETLLGQLADNGCMVIPVGDLGSQRMTVIRRRGERLDREFFHSFAFVPLVGREGWSDFNS